MTAVQATQVSILKEESESLRRRIEARDASVVELSATNRRLEGDVRGLNIRVGDLTEENGKLRDRNNEISYKVADLSRSNEALHKYSDDLQRRLAIAERRRAEAESVPRPGVRAQEEFGEETDLPSEFLHVANEALERFSEGYAEYGPGAADALGLAGQWGDLHRKVAKLKRPLWNGEDGALTRETEQDILQDIIGHCLLALEMLNRGFEGGRG